MTAVKLDPPELKPLSQILPPEPLLLMGAGPVPIPHQVAVANSVVINHLGDTMDRVIARVKEMARYAFQTTSDKVIGVAGPASAAMEMAISNLLWPGRKALVLKIGTFSGRFGEMAEGVGADVTYLEGSYQHPITPEMVQDLMNREHFDVITMVQGETSCGVLNKDLQQIAAIAKSKGALVIVDAVVTLTTMPCPMDEWQLDAVVTGGQKGLSSIPGVSLIAFSNQAWEVVEQHEQLRGQKRTHWCLDATRAQRFWGHKQYHYTAPVPGILAIHEALRLICQETLSARFERHLRSSLALQAGIETMGLRLLVPEEYRLNSVVAIDLPEGISGDQVRSFMVDKFRVEIAGAFGLNIIRVGQMGEQCRSANLFKTLYAMGMSFRNAGVNLDVAAGMGALEQKLAGDNGHFVD